MIKKIVAVCMTVIMAGSMVLTGCSKKNETDVENKEKVTQITMAAYDASREFLTSYNELFQTHWKEETGKNIEVGQQYGGAGSLTEAMEMDAGEDMALLPDAHAMQQLEQAGMVKSGWDSRDANQAVPFTSHVVLLVRKEKAKKITDWGDLVRKGIEVITPDPTVSGMGRWNFLAAYAYAKQYYRGDTAKITHFLKKLYSRVLYMDESGRQATDRFVENAQGDVLITWESEAYLALEAYPDDYTLVTPSVSVQAEPAVAVLDQTAGKAQVTKEANGYIQYLYSDEAQRLAADNYLRPVNEQVMQEYAGQFTESAQVFSIEDLGGWEQVWTECFAEGALFDQINPDA